MASINEMKLIGNEMTMTTTHDNEKQLIATSGMAQVFNNVKNK